MNSTISKVLGLLGYFLVMGLLLDFNWTALIRPRPFLSVIAGMLILTLSQYKKSFTKEDLMQSAKWNVLFAGFLAALMSLLSFISSSQLNNVHLPGMVEHVLPLLYGSIIYLLLNLLADVKSATAQSASHMIEQAYVEDIAPPISQEDIFLELELTKRECHVAIKLLENITNKEIAVQLYISEATVKKHIQNIYQKLQVSDRNSFREVFYSKLRSDNSWQK